MLPATHHRLATELALWIAAQIRRLATWKDSPAGPIADSAASPLKTQLWTLWEIGCATTTDEHGAPPRNDNGAPPPHFRIAADPEIRAILEARELYPKHLSNLIAAFVRMHDHIPGAFALSGGIARPDLPEPLADAFVAAGLLERTGAHSRWLDPMAERVSYTVPDHAWETDEESKARRYRTYGPIWATMPWALTWQVLVGGKFDMLLLTDAIRRFYDGAEWRSEELPDWEDEERLAAATHIARELERLRGERQLSLNRYVPASALQRVLRRRGD